MNPPPLIHLSDNQPLASGHNRLVFAHPEAPNLVIKVARPGLPWSTRPFARYNYWRDCRREQLEYLRLAAVHNRTPGFVVRFCGYINTDLGVGMVYEKAATDQGALAPTLRSLLDAGGLDAAQWQLVLQFYHEALDSPVVIGDLNAPNIVYCCDDQGNWGFKVIDGLGDKRILPLLRLLPFLNRFRKCRRIRRNLRGMGYADWRTFA